MHFIWVFFLFSIVEPCKYDGNDDTLQDYTPLQKCGQNCVVKYNIPPTLRYGDQMVITVKYLSLNSSDSSMCISLRKQSGGNTKQPSYSLKINLEDNDMTDVNQMPTKVNQLSQLVTKNNQDCRLKEKVMRIEFSEFHNKEFVTRILTNPDNALNKTIQTPVKNIAELNQVIINGDIVKVEKVEITWLDDPEHKKRPSVSITSN